MTHLLQHLQRNTTTILHLPGSKQLLTLSRSYPLIQTTLLALTACHLRHLVPQNKEHSVAELFYLSISLEEYRKLLGLPRDQLGSEGKASLLLSAVLLNVLAFALPNIESELHPESSWVFSPRHDRLGWLALQAGLRALVKSLPGMEEWRIMLYMIFCGTDEMELEFLTVPPQLPQRWIWFFELEKADEYPENTEGGCVLSTSNVFRVPLTILGATKDLAPNDNNLFKQFFFLGKMTSGFRSLLYERDDRALWIFGYWVGLMCRYVPTIWWCTTRMKRDYDAILLWLIQRNLTQRPNPEGALWREMMQELILAPIFSARSDPVVKEVQGFTQCMAQRAPPASQPLLAVR